MKHTVQARLDVYMEAFEQIREKVGDDHIAAVLLQEIAKDNRMEQMRTERNGQPTSNLPATDKQLAYLHRLGVEVPNQLTKQEASELIDQATAKAAL